MRAPFGRGIESACEAEAIRRVPSRRVSTPTLTLPPAPETSRAARRESACPVYGRVRERSSGTVVQGNAKIPVPGIRVGSGTQPQNRQRRNGCGIVFRRRTGGGGLVVFLGGCGGATTGA